jgi:Dolichyl-phosphate-mannose-protein mannosyltransferase
MSASTSIGEPLLTAWPSRSAAQVALFVAAQSILWALIPGLVHYAPPVDTVEVYMWARDWILVSNKHPNMAGWMLAASQWLTGAYGWSAYLLSSICTAVTILFVYLVGRDATDDRTAMLGAILPCTLVYFNWLTPQFNANIASMPFWAGFVWAVWKARRHGTLLWWIVVGVIGAGVIYCKISGGILLLVAGLYALYDARLRSQLLTPGPWVAVLVFAALLAPLALEIRDLNHTIFQHAAGKARGSANQLTFLGVQILMCLGLLLVLASSARRAAENASRVTTDPATTRDTAIFVAVFALGPLAITLAQSLLFSIRLHNLWAIPMGSYFGLASVIWLHRYGFDIDETRIRKLTAAILLAVPLVYAGVKTLHSPTGWAATTAWPQKEISRRFETIWEAETNAPLKLVAGDAWEGGLVALSAKQMPSLLIDMEERRAPWIGRDRIIRDGLLIIWPFTYKEGDHKLRSLTQDCQPKAENFVWPGKADRKPITLHYCIIPPRR